MSPRSISESLARRAAVDALVNAYRLGGRVAKWTPAPIGLSMASLVGRSAALSHSDRRRIVERNLRRAYGADLRGWALSRKVQATYDSYARYYFDTLRLPSLSATAVERGIWVDGLEHLTAAMAEDRVGPVLALPHLGGWEWAAAWVTKVRGWQLAAVVERLEPDELFEWFRAVRQQLGIDVIPLDHNAMAKLTAAAKAKSVVCLLADRDIGGNGVPVTFFGEPTTLPAGPAMMALRNGCRLLPTAVYFNDGDGVTGVVRPPIDASRQGSLREDIARITQALALELEYLIRRAPEQWHLMQPNWPSDYEALGLPVPGTVGA